MRRIVLDTNAILDAAMAERPDHAAALLLLDDVGFGGTEAFTPASSLKDVYYILTKYFGEANARAYVAAMLEAFHIEAVDAALCRCAILSDEPDFEDGIVRACAEALEADFIISRDEKAFRTSTIRRLSPREYAELFCDVESTSIQ